MRRRPVFDDIVLRSEFRDRLGAAGIGILDAKLNLRPSFPLRTLVASDSRQAVKAALEWFALTFHTRVTIEQADLVETGEALGTI